MDGVRSIVVQASMGPATFVGFSSTDGSVAGGARI
jgi:hypothetical protein